jgi:hypothetical protein
MRTMPPRFSFAPIVPEGVRLDFLAQPFAHRNVHPGSGLVTIMLGVNAGRQGDVLNRVAIDDGGGNIIVPMNRVKKQIHRYALERLTDALRPLPRTEYSATKSSPVMTPGSAWAARTGSSMIPRLKLCSEIPFRVRTVVTFSSTRLSGATTVTDSL